MQVIEWNERRDLVFRCSDEKCGDLAYFAALSAYMDDPANQRAMFDFLKTRDISGFNPRARHLTAEYREVRNNSMPPIYRFLGWLITDLAHSAAWTIERGPTALHDTCLRFFRQLLNMSDFKMSMTAFGRDIKKVPGVSQHHTSSNQRMYTIDRRAVRDFLLQNNIIGDMLFDLGADLVLVELPPDV